MTIVASTRISKLLANQNSGNQEQCVVRALVQFISLLFADIVRSFC